jgi:hypothetical protein
MTDDYEGGFAGASLEDDYGAESFANLNSPWDYQADDHQVNDEYQDKDSAKRGREATYREQDGHVELSDDFNVLTAQIRRLQDVQGWHLGFYRGLRENDPDRLSLQHQKSGQRIVVGRWSEISRTIDWVNLPTDHPLLDLPFPWEQEARVDQTRKPPIGMEERLWITGALVHRVWQEEHPYNRDPWEALGRSLTTHPAELEIRQRLLKDESFQPVHPERLDQLEKRKQQTRKEREELERLRERQHDALGKIKREVVQAMKKVFGEETRGGARVARPAAGKAKEVFLGDLTSGRFSFHNFKARSTGKGAARKDERAIRLWLCSELVPQNGRRYLAKADSKPGSEPRPGPYDLDDYKRAFKGGPKAKEMRPVIAEGITRARELKGDGAFVNSIAAEIGCSERTLREHLKKG